MVFRQAAPWEFRWRVAFTYGSLPVVAMMAVVSGLAGGPWYAPPVRFELALVGALLGTLGVVLRLWGSHVLTSRVMLQNNVSADQLVQTGPFSFVQNPLYLGTLLILAGWSLWYGWIACVLFTALHGVRFHRIVLLEDAALRMRWGTPFDSYSHRVSRWIPSLSGVLRAGLPRFGLAEVCSNGPLVGMSLALWAAVAWRVTTPLFPAILAGMLTTQAYLRLRRRHTVANPTEVDVRPTAAAN